MAFENVRMFTRRLRALVMLSTRSRDAIREVCLFLSAKERIAKWTAQTPVSMPRDVSPTFEWQVYSAAYTFQGARQ
jgi:hypothetical protein